MFNDINQRNTTENHKKISPKFTKMGWVFFLSNSRDIEKMELLCSLLRS